MNRYIEMLLEAAEELGWNCDCTIYANGKVADVEFRQESPAGEDFFFCVDASNGNELAKQVRDYYLDFDTEKHITDLIVAKMNGLKGVPSIHTLVEDADAIEKMLEDLVEALESVEVCEEEEV